MGKDLGTGMPTNTRGERLRSRWVERAIVIACLAVAATYLFAQPRGIPPSTPTMTVSGCKLTGWMAVHNDIEGVYDVYECDGSQLVLTPRGAPPEIPHGGVTDREI